MDVANAPKVVHPTNGSLRWLGGMGVRFLIPGTDSGRGFALVEHVLKPHALAAAMHRHHLEDEYSYVLHGKVGARLDGQVVYGTAGDVIYKPRGQWHTFWNAADSDASLLEIIAPAGFENFFRELLELFAQEEPRPEKIAPIAQRYQLELDPSSIPTICAEHGLSFG